MSAEQKLTVKVNLDETKVHIITRAQRLRGVAIETLTTVHTILSNQGQADDPHAKQIAEAIAWLNEMKV